MPSTLAAHTPPQVPSAAVLAAEQHGADGAASVRRAAVEASVPGGAHLAAGAVASATAAGAAAVGEVALAVAGVPRGAAVASVVDAAATRVLQVSLRPVSVLSALPCILDAPFVHAGGCTQGR